METFKRQVIGTGDCPHLILSRSGRDKASTFTTRHLNADDADSPQIDADLTGFVSLRAENPRKSVFFGVNLRPRKSVSGNESATYRMCGYRRDFSDRL